MDGGLPGAAAGVPQLFRLEFLDLIGAAVPPPPCLVMSTHQGKQLGFLLMLDIDSEHADILEGLRVRYRGEGNSGVRAGLDSLRTQEHPQCDAIIENCYTYGVVSEFSRRFDVRHTRMHGSDDGRQLHGFVRVVRGTDGQWRVPTTLAGHRDPAAEQRLLQIFMLGHPGEDEHDARAKVKALSVMDVVHQRLFNFGAGDNLMDMPVGGGVQVLMPGICLGVHIPCHKPGGNQKHCVNRKGHTGFDPVCPRACTSAGCSSTGGVSTCKATGLRIWCHKCDVACYCSMECKREHRQAHAPICQDLQRLRQAIGFDRVCYHCGIPDTQTRLQVCGQCRQVLYCSRECSKRAWKAGHRQECQKPK